MTSRGRKDIGRPPLTRRSWLGLAIAGTAGRTVLAQQAKDAVDPDRAETRAIQAVATAAKLRTFQYDRTEHFLGIGDAAAAFIQLTLRDAESLASDFIDYYRGLGFEVAMPKRRLSIVVLADDRSFAAFAANPSFKLKPSRREPTPSVRGFYHPETNRLVIFDHRSLGPQLSARPAVDNIRNLAHEGTHLLSFNTGLLDVRSDVPTCIVEGLAMFGEVRKTSGRQPPGQTNLTRLNDLARLQRMKLPWIPAAQLLESDNVLSAAATYQGILAYAESWLLVDYLLKTPARVPTLRAYLAALRDPATAGTRIEVARKHLGDLETLDRDLRAYSLRLMKG